MSPSTLMVLPLAVALTTLVPLAQASPPDPLWTGGVFDAEDFDDVVVIAVSVDGATVGAALDDVRALWLILGVVPPAGSISPIRSVPPAFQGRAPPIA